MKPLAFMAATTNFENSLILVLYQFVRSLANNLLTQLRYKLYKVNRRACCGRHQLEETKLNLSAHTSQGTLVETRRPRATLKLSPVRQAAEVIFKPRPEPVAAHTSSNTPESEHAKTFRLISEGRYEEAARLAKKLIDTGNVDGFFIFSGTPSYRRAEAAYTANVATSKRGVFTEVVTAGAELAQVILKANEDNRLINQRGLVDRIRDIAEDRWQLNGQGIIVAKTGELNDGQHRLWAILLTGKPVRIPIFFGAQRETRGTVDTGKIRLTKDRFRFAGIPNDTRASSVVSLAHKIIMGRDATESEKLDFYNDDPDTIQAAVHLGNGTPKGTPVQAFCTAGYLLLRNGRSPEKVSTFFREARGSETPRKNSPSFALLKILLSKESKQLGRTPVEQAYTMADLYLRWEAGKTLRGTVEVQIAAPEALGL